MPMKMAGGDSDEEDLDSLRLAALRSLQDKKRSPTVFTQLIATSQSQPQQWPTLGARRGGARPFNNIGGRGRGSPRKPLYGSTRGNGYMNRGGWQVQQPINRSNLISIVPIGSEETLPVRSFCKPVGLELSAMTAIDTKLVLPQDHYCISAEVAKLESEPRIEQKSSVPSKFSRYERSDSDESEEEEEEDATSSPIKEDDSADEDEEAAEAMDSKKEAPQPIEEDVDPDVILMQDEDSLGKLLDEFEQEFGDDEKPKRRCSVSASTSVKPKKFAVGKTFSDSHNPPVRKIVPDSLSPKRSPSPPPRERRLSPVSPRRSRRSVSPERRRGSPRAWRFPRRRSRSGSRRHSPSWRVGSRRSITPERHWPRQISPCRRSPPSHHSPIKRRSTSPYRRFSPPRERSTSQSPPRTLMRKHAASPSIRTSKRNLSPHDKLFKRSLSPVPYAPYAPKRPRLNISRNTVSPPPQGRSHSVSRSCSSSVLSLSPSPPPRKVQACRRRMVPIKVVKTDKRKFLVTDNEKMTNKTTKDPLVRSKKEARNNLKVKSKPKDVPLPHHETKVVSTVLEARRRKFESSAPIHVESNKIIIRLKKLNKEEINETLLNSSMSQSEHRSSSPSDSDTELEPAERQDKVRISDTEEMGDIAAADSNPQETSAKSDDLRAELRRRRAERLTMIGSAHHNLPTRLVQNALHGAVGKAALQRREKKDAKDSPKRTEAKTGKAEGRRVMVVHKQDGQDVAGSEAKTESQPEAREGSPSQVDSSDSIETAAAKKTSSPNQPSASPTKGMQRLQSEEQSKWPVHSRLGNVAGNLAAPRSHRRKNKTAKSKSHGHQQQRTSSGKGRKVHLKRSMLVKSPPHNEEKVMWPDLGCSFSNHPYPGNCFTLLIHSTAA